MEKMEIRKLYNKVFGTSEWEITRVRKFDPKSAYIEIELNNLNKNDSDPFSFPRKIYSPKPKKDYSFWKKHEGERFWVRYGITASEEIEECIREDE